MALIREYRGFDPNGDGYHYIQTLETKGWRAVSAWGQDGWDLGEWPYLVYMICDNNGEYMLRERCEGDLYTWVYDSAEDREKALNEIAARQWRINRERYGISEDELPNKGEIPAKFRGPFTWERIKNNE